jgi:uncharacterized protein
MIKKNLNSQFKVNIHDLTEGKSILYQFDIGPSFFTYSEESLINNSDLKVNILLNKNVNLITCDFTITGTIELTCDTSLENFDYELDIKEKIFFKISNQALELDFNLYSINAANPYIYFAQHIYDLVHVSVPMKKIHPTLLNGI